MKPLSGQLVSVTSLISWREPPVPGPQVHRPGTGQEGQTIGLVLPFHNQRRA
jgi:hypothetical protein